VKQEDVDLDGSWTDTPLVSGELEVVRSALPPGRVTVDSQFEEVPDSLLNPQRWKTSRFGTWMWPADISELEARALTMCLQRLCGFENFRNMRQVMIVDNMGVCLAFDRHRARSFPLLTQVRRFSAYSLVRNLRITVRWVPSEKNSADAPSRITTSIATQHSDSNQVEAPVDGNHVAHVSVSEDCADQCDEKIQYE